MKYAVALFATVLIAMTSLGAQNFAFLWKTAPDDSFPVLNPKAKVGISEFGAAYAQAHDYYELAREIGEALKAEQPRIGKDIKWGRNNDGEAIGWYRYKGLEGFKLERVETK